MLLDVFIIKEQLGIPMINIRQKGAEGERQVLQMLNKIVGDVREEKGLPQFAKEDEPFQRNQNQSAVGGDDLTNPYFLSIEVKRQEQLSINTWWKQCIASAERTKGVPILIFKQNRKKWRVCMNAPLYLTTTKFMGPVKVEVDLEIFKWWFYEYYTTYLEAHPDGPF